MENKKQNWAEIEDDEEDTSRSPQLNQDQDDNMTIEYKLQPTGESINYNGGSRQTGYNNNRGGDRDRKPIKKPLLSADEMITQINTDKHYNVFLHCFGVQGNAANFRETFESKVKFVNLIESNNGDRDTSIDLKFDDKEEAIKFIKLSQSTNINGKNFRVKFGKLLKHGGEGFKKGDSYNKDKPRTGGHERREFRGGDDKREHRGGEERREYRGGDRFGGRNDNREHREPREHRERGEYKPYYKREHQEKREEKPVEKVEETTTQQTTEAPVEPAKRFGFTNSKKNLPHETTTAAEQIHCVDTNAKIVEKQKRDEQEKIAKQEEEKKLHPEGTEQEKVEKTEKVEKKEHHQHHNKETRGDNRGHNHNNHQGKTRREDGSKGKQQKSTNENHKSEKVVYEKKESDKTAQAPVEGQKTEQNRNDDKSQGRKKLKLQEENQKKFDDEWNVVPVKTNDKKRNDDRKGGNHNDRKNNNNNNSNNNNKKSQVTYARKDEQK